jgi:hypothetical protein
MNAKQELIKHIGNREVKYVHIIYGDEWCEDRKVIEGTLAEVLPLLDFQYYARYGCQELFGNVWYTDGTWSERAEYDGSEWWEYKSCPPIPDTRKEA